MKALSLTQPWASLVAIGAKRVETRSWSTTHRGTLAIHAAKGFPGWAKDACLDNTFAASLMAGGITLVSQLPLGAIVAVVDVLNVAPTDHLNAELWAPFGSPEHRFGDYSPGRYAWLLGNVRRLATPVPCKGALGLWDVPSDALAAVREQLA